MPGSRRPPFHVQSGQQTPKWIRGALRSHLPIVAKQLLVAEKDFYRLAFRVQCKHLAGAAHGFGVGPANDRFEAELLASVAQIERVRLAQAVAASKAHNVAQRLPPSH